ncbi:type VII secretion protein EssC [Enterococcus cecorum]|uniref:type VII secretion protein EssC n=1 Tax=Enterococcus cecorum TaxID=44008 RepID=UPI001FADC220|nr:type VII secretion protein EssC [Enterococcus cecorum]MCJ0538602.1 type VII secretion protein EssC [Enterococcus cecorum]MCJ0545255.1 type VII secretion protein EssC [Enterococcus cecorum]MCJ0551078.1 type VII secretion protein EssC [Enterococcus cecorum]MCJ0568234.1 type VII secretion protein EssC [Enterococcus cecorum]
MAEFFVIVFGGNEYFQYKIRDILANSFNGIVSEEFAFKGIRYYFPIVVDGDQYAIDDRNANWKFAINGEELHEKRILRSGDYIRVSNKDVSLSMLVIEYSQCSLGAKAYALKSGSTYFIGRSDEMNIVINSSASVSRKHASIRVDGVGNVFVDGISGKTGVYINGKRETNYQVKNGDHIFIMGISMVVFGSTLLVPSNVQVNGIELSTQLESVLPSEDAENALYVRTPRIQKTLDTDAIEIDHPTPPQKQKEQPFILTAGPSITMTLAMLASLGVTISRVLSAESKDYASIIPSAIMAISMLLGALLWPKLSRSYNKRVMEANEQYRQKKYRQYLSEKEGEIAHSYERNTRIWNESLYPSCSELISNIESQNRHLWERSCRDEDFLEVKLGTGQRPFEVDVVIKKSGFELEEDFLKAEAYELADKYRELKKVSITLSLMAHKVVGVVGDYDLIARNIITNLVSLYSPDEVKIVLVYNRYQEKQLSVYNDLPHMWSADKTSRYVATTEAEAYSLFSELDEKIQAREETLEKDDLRIPHYVVLTFDQTIVDSVPFKKTLVNTDNHWGISSIFFGERFNQIPKECEAIVQRNDETCGVYIKNENDNRFILFTPDEVSTVDVNRLVKALSKVQIKKEKAASNVPERISFLDVYQVGNVGALNIASHWNANASNKSLAAPIGVMAGGDMFYLDIHEKYHGCHGLVAGTTGSGKSEFLQAYILSMMINYSPNEVAFVLVDFKGGDMARPFLNSPHLAATISNLSGNTLYRALVSLEAEVKNRQRIFNESTSLLGVDKLDINSYHRYFKEHRLTEPLPHLIIVIDEFAQLKTQHPEFMAKLIDVAQVGRSLGIHLILATQKPSGVVDPQIWSNSRFKVCLKVMDKQDSSDMINKPVAAMIKTPGRAYVQVGYDEIFELIQSGYSGAEYVPQDTFINEDSVTVSMVNWPGEQLREAKDIARGEKSDLTQLEAVMKEMYNLGIDLHLKSKKLWLDPLREQLLLEELEITEDETFGTVSCGRMDLPHIQKQYNYTIDFVKNGHLAIYGSSGTGKSTLIQTIFYAMALKYSPAQFNSFIIDFNGGSLIGLSKMPHCAEYVTDESENKVNQLLSTIGRIITDRRAKFVEANCANYESYLESGKTDMPIILAVIDNYASFREKMYRCEDLLVQHIAAARACGIYFIITGSSKGAIYYKVTDHISNKVVFNMNDTGSYRDILNVHIPIFPENIKGRALVAYEKTVAEMQVAVPFDAESESNRVQQINAYYASLKEQYGDAVVYDAPIQDDFNFFEEEENEPIYQKQEMKKYSGSGDENALILGTELKTGEKIDFSLVLQRLAFVANRNNDANVVKDICDKLIASGASLKIYTKRFEQMGIDEICLISDIDAFINGYAETNDVMLIDGFSDLFDEISDEALTQFEILLRDSNKMIVTIDDMSRISDYSSTELYLKLVKCEFGMVVSGRADNGFTYLLSDYFYNIPEEYRAIELEENQAIVYYKDMASFIQLGGQYE